MYPGVGATPQGDGFKTGRMVFSPGNFHPEAT